MVVVQSIDFAYYLIARINDDRHGNGRLVATIALAGVFFPSFAGIAGPPDISSAEAVVCFLMALLLTIVYGYLRREPLEYLRKTRAGSPSMRERIVVALYLFLSAVLSVLVARTSAWAGPAVFLLISALPWQRWADRPVGAP